MEKEILHKLSQIEKNENVKILFAVESGSRAWGFASPDSDYDIRFVYKHKKEWYLNLWEQKDTIQFMTEDDLDGSGWDLRKALRLLAKSNASFLGWLFSPIIYQSDSEFLEEMRNLAMSNFNPVSGFYHYHSMNKNFEETLGSEQMTLKSFFYAIRTALCAKWVYQFETIPPVDFRELYPLIDEGYHAKLDDLILLKSKHMEKSKEAVDFSLIALVKEVVDSNKQLKDSLVNRKSTPKDFNTFFLKTIA